MSRTQTKKAPSLKESSVRHHALEEEIEREAAKPRVAAKIKYSNLFNSMIMLVRFVDLGSSYRDGA